MTYTPYSSAIRAVAATLCGTLLVACGGGSSTDDTASIVSSMDATAASISAGRGTTANTTPATSSKPAIPAVPATPSTPVAPVVPPVVAAPSNSAVAITNVRLENTSSVMQTNAPVTFGQVFTPGHLAKNTGLVGRLDSGETVQLQVDVKATHADGSVRHAVISGVLPSIAASQTRTMDLVPNTSATQAAAPTAAQLLSGGFTASISATIGGVQYTASADELIKNGKAVTWLAGPTVNEWQVSAPLMTANGTQHPHLNARFAVRWYEGAHKARVDVVIENTWAYEASPQNFTYDAQVTVGGKVVYTQPALTHYHHARWRKLFWWGGAEPTVDVKHNVAYLIGTRALPNYDQSTKIPETVLASMQKKWAASSQAPMGLGLSVKFMPQVGGRDDIGLLPSWAATYLLTMDKRAKDATLGTATLAGSWSSHYRDKVTGQPVSLIDYPYMTIYGRSTDTKNKATGKNEAFPSCPSATTCKTPYSHDVSHQPAFAYLPYVVTGDHYYLEELQFWSMFNIFSSNPGYRSNIQGLVKPEQVRGQAWSMRTLAEAAYITPDSDRLKQHFERILDSNLDWFNANYTDNAAANKLGVITNGYAVVYNKQLGVGPWQDDFFTSAIGHASDLGYAKATKLLKWKVQYPISRMVGEGACYISGAMYKMSIRASVTGPYFTTIAEAFKASVEPEVQKLECGSAAMAKALKLTAGEMTGYSNGYAGYPSNMQPALAYGADVGGAEGAKAWAKFMSRSVKPDYAKGPQFAIVPR